MTVPLRRGLPLVGLALLGLLAGSGCDAGRVADAGSSNTAFPGTAPIHEITPGQECVVSTRPSFAWEATGHALVHAGVFSENLDIHDGRITNVPDNVWYWHTGLGSGREGSVTWAQGVSMAQDDAGEPEPLTHGEGYVWAVWAWDEETLEVVASSPEIFFQADSTADVLCP